MDYIPGRGDLVWLMFDPQARHEQAGHRPALVISPQSYNAKTGLALTCPITSQVKGFPFEVAISVGLPIIGVILSDQIKNLDWRARKAEFISTLSIDITADVIAKIATLIK
jgi:mRNA interferase MazF